jgi:phage gpG-like protein
MKRKLANFQARIADKSKIISDIGNYMAEGIRQRLLSGRNVNGSNFVSSNRVKNNGGQTLINTGNLLESIKTWIEGDTIVYGSDWIYAHVLNLGATISGPMSFYDYVAPGKQYFFSNIMSVVIPQRQFMGQPTEEEQSTVNSMMMAFYEEAWDVSG